MNGNVVHNCYVSYIVSFFILQQSKTAEQRAIVKKAFDNGLTHLNKTTMELCRVLSTKYGLSLSEIKVSFYQNFGAMLFM